MRGVRESRIFDTKTQARGWALRREAELLDRPMDAAPVFTFGEVCDKYIDEVSSKKDGRRWELMRIETFRAFFGGDTPLEQIGPPQVAEWIDHRLTTVTGGTVKREKNLLNHMFTMARDTWLWCEHRPFRGVKIPQENEEREVIWRWQQIKRVLRAPGGPKTKEVIDAFHLALRTSLRLQEVLIAPTVFDAKRQVCVIPAEFNKTGRTETVPIGRIAARLLQRKPFTVSANEASTLFARLTASLGIDGLTFHDTRATALTYLAPKLSLLQLSKVSRHRDVRILQRRYYRERPEDIARKI